MQSISYSQITAGMQCPRKLRLMKDNAQPDYMSGDLAFGTTMHSAIHGCILGKNAEEIFSTNWDFCSEGYTFGRYKWEELKDIGLTLLSKFDRLHKKNYDPSAFMEERIFDKIEGLEGTPDYVGMYKGKLSLRDFKTSGTPYKKEKLIVGSQLHLYAYLYYTKTGKWVETLGYDVFCKSTSSIQNLTVDLDKDKVIGSVSHLNVLKVALFSLTELAPKVYSSCIIGSQKCQYFNTCHEGGKNGTADGNE